MLRRLSGDIHDPRDGEWVFDSSSLINLRVAGLLDIVMTQFASRAHLVAEVMGELDKGATGPAVRAEPWFAEEHLDAATHLPYIRLLRQRWGSAPGRDEGEAASIVLAKTNRWRMVCEDHVAYAAARTHEGICVMRTVDLLVAMVRCGWVSGDAAWDGYRAMVDARRALGVVPWNNRVEFDQLCSPRRGFNRCLN